VLSGAVASEDLHLGYRLASVEEDGAALRLVFANGRVERADIVVGADGVRSVVRDWVLGGRGRPRYSGTSAFRGIVPVSSLPSLPDPQAIQFWMGPGAHLLHYAIGGQAQDVNFFAVVEGPAEWPRRESWTIPTRVGETVAAFAGWHPAVTEMIAASTFEARWGLFVVSPLRRWHRAAAVLLGDAVHAMLPHHGQGANTTIEDAITLANLIAGRGLVDLEATLVRYEQLRRLRTRTIQQSSWATNHALHLPDGRVIAGRNERVTSFPEDFAWIHAFDANAAVSRSAEQHLFSDNEAT
jgi:salicylate hydroxylase